MERSNEESSVLNGLVVGLFEHRTDEDLMNTLGLGCDEEFVEYIKEYSKNYRTNDIGCTWVEIDLMCFEYLVRLAEKWVKANED